MNKVKEDNIDSIQRLKKICGDFKECLNVAETNREREGKRLRDGEAEKRDYLHLAFDRLAVGINTIG